MKKEENSQSDNSPIDHHELKQWVAPAARKLDVSRTANQTGTGTDGIPTNGFNGS